MRRSKEGLGWEPDFPEGVDSVLLADCNSANWGLYEFFPGDTSEEWDPPKRVSDDLEVLIGSGKMYPPALAIARDRVSQEYESREPTQAEFASTFAGSLLAELSRQPDSGYFLAPARIEQLGFLCKGKWYWILGMSESLPDTVRWVSGDFFIYDNAITDFDFTKQQLKQLRNGKV